MVLLWNPSCCPLLRELLYFQPRPPALGNPLDLNERVKITKYKNINKNNSIQDVLRTHKFADGTPGDCTFTCTPVSGVTLFLPKKKKRKKDCTDVYPTPANHKNQGNQQPGQIILHPPSLT